VRKTIDCWIATFCIREPHSLLHRDRPFDPFEALLGLVVVRPLSGKRLRARPNHQGIGHRGVPVEI